MRRFDRGEGAHLEARGSHMWFKATAAATSGRFSLMERTLPPGGRMPPPHHHVGNDEAYYVLEGEVEFRIDGEVAHGGPDTCVVVPPGASHTFGNTSAAPARLLVLHAPGLDAYFEELARLWSASTPPTRDQELELMSRHGMVPD
jgi:mannose-6-phosphate isomerase-like protein (cupin superfamily)